MFAWGAITASSTELIDRGRDVAYEQRATWNLASQAILAAIKNEGFE